MKSIILILNSLILPGPSLDISLRSPVGTPGCGVVADQQRSPGDGCKELVRTSTSLRCAIERERVKLWISEVFQKLGSPSELEALKDNRD